MKVFPRSAPSIALAALLFLAVATPAGSVSLHRLVDDTAHAHPNALWHIVHDLCAVDQKVSGQPAPCVKVDLTAGYALLKDIEGHTQYLLLPTARRPGIESPELLEPDSPNYWQAAWAARGLVGQALGRPLRRGTVGLAINSEPGRTQNQLHIHIDCVRGGVRRTLAARLGEIGTRWSRLRIGPYGRLYRVRWVAGADLGAHDPFKLLARGDARARADMGQETLAVIAATRPGGAEGFVLLADRVDLAHGDQAAAEELLDHSCSGVD